MNYRRPFRLADHVIIAIANRPAARRRAVGSHGRLRESEAPGRARVGKRRCARDRDADRRRAAGKTSFEIAKRGVAHSPEGRRVFSTLSVEDNLTLGAFTPLAWLGSLVPAGVAV